ncbi:MAG: acyl-CoA dehydrogenase family protein [Rhodopila sp.]
MESRADHADERTARHARCAELFRLAQSIELENGPAIDDPAVQEKLAEFYTRSQGLKFTKFRGMTALSRGQTPGPESSIIKVVAANKLQDILSYGLDMIGMAGPTMGDSMPVAGIFEEALLYSPALRLRTSLPNAYSVCRRTQGPTKDFRSATSRPGRESDGPQTAQFLLAGIDRGSGRLT